MDFSSDFNTIIPNLLLPKLTQLSVPTSVCQWINSFLTDRQQLVRLGKYTSSTRSISTGAPQGCVLSPLLFSLYTNDCTSKDPSVKLLKFADDTTLIGLIQDGEESAYRQEVKELAVWCSLNNLELNTLKTVEMIVDFRRNPPALPPLTIMDSTVTTVESFRFHLTFFFIIIIYLIILRQWVSSFFLKLSQHHFLQCGHHHLSGPEVGQSHRLHC